MGRKKLDLTGKTFGRLTVLSFAGMSAEGRSMWATRCSCGTEQVTPNGNLTSGNTKSCGCLNREVSARMLGDLARTHGMNNTPIRKSWSGMWTRCTNPSDGRYQNYGGRGITVCERWKKFSNFYADMGERPLGTSLDRIDNEKGYSPDNCRWATSKEQAQNMSTNRKVEHAGETLCISEWARHFGMHRDTLVDRLDRGWTASEALTRPLLLRAMRKRETK